MIPSQLREVQQDKTNMTEGESRACHSPLWVGKLLFNRGGVAQAWYCMPPTPPQKKPPFVEWGGETGVFYRGVAQARHCTSPIPPLPTPHVREKSTLPKHGTARPLSPPKNPPFVEWGGGRQGVFPVASPKNGTASRLSPPRKTHYLCNGGGGGKGVFTVASHKHGTKLKMRLTSIFGDIPKAADNALTQRRLWKTVVVHCGERRWWQRQQRLTTTTDGGCGRRLSNDKFGGA